MATTVREIQYHAYLYAPNAQRGPGALKADLTPLLLNIVWQRGLNLPGMVAFTLARPDPRIDQIAWMIDHVKVFREDAGGSTCIFAGRMVKPQYGATDVVCLAWNYVSFLQLSRTGYNVEYLTKALGTEIVSPEWVLAKGATNSPLEFVTTGTIEDPLGIDGTTPIKTNDDFGVALFNRLFVFFQLAEMGMANTSNTVVFEITDTTPHTFNFWKNRNVDSGLVLSYPGNVAEHDYQPGYELIRNDRATVLEDPTTGDAAYVVEDPTSVALYGRLQDALTLKTLMGLNSNATEADQGKEAMARLLKEGLRSPKGVTIWPRQGLIRPFANLSLADKVSVRLRNESSGALLYGSARLVGMAGSWSATGGEAIQLQVRGLD